jgi:hypothetical protein
MSFFYDEDNHKFYDSIHDWYREIRHLIWPAVIAVGVAIALYTCAKYFY